MNLNENVYYKTENSLLDKYFQKGSKWSFEQYFNNFEV